MKEIEHERRDWIIVAIILLFGLLSVLIAGEWALRFSPRWQLDADMGSKLDPNGNFLPNRPVEVVQAIDPSILTQPVWFDTFLTPGAIIPTRVRATATSTPTRPPTSVAATNTNAPTSLPTNTLVYFPPTQIGTSNPAPTKTAAPTSKPVNTTTPTPTGTSISPSTSTATPTRTPTPTFTSTPTRTFTPTITATNTSTPTSTATFTNTPTPTITPTSTNIPTSTPTFTPTSTSTPTPTPTNTPPAEADLQIQISDGVSSVMVNGSTTYTIVVSNHGPRIVNGASVTTNFSANLQNITWTCSSSGGTACAASGTGNISDNSVTLPSGMSVTYIVNATVVSSPIGDLTSSAAVSTPVGITDPNSLNNASTDTDTIVFAIGTTPDGIIYNVTSGTYLTLNVQLTSGPGWDVVYYERPNASGVLLDWMIVEVSTDGANWSQIFNWGDELPDRNTNVNYEILPDSPQTPEERDQREIPSSVLYNSTGIAIDLDALGLSGNYSYIRFYAPPGDIDGHSEVDAVQVLH